MAEVATAAEAASEVGSVEDGGVASEFGEAVGGVEEDEFVEIIFF